MFTACNLAQDLINQFDAWVKCIKCCCEITKALLPQYYCILNRFFPIGELLLLKCYSGFPLYSRGLCAWKIQTLANQNRQFKPKLG